jgi:glycosyltransferase involved in cell wall biosynthesis
LLYICIPTYNEAPTVGVLLWRIRKVFQDYSREYEVLIYDDASKDGTQEALQPYTEVLPLTILRGDKRRGYGYAVNTLAREVSNRTKYARRDAMIIMQADFTDQPEHLPELIKRFEAGADIVIAEREVPKNTPKAVKRLHKFAPWAIKPFLSTKKVSDPFGSFRLYRISLLRELIKTLNDKPIITADGWAANVELLLRSTPFARRIERVKLAPRYDLRTRESRIRPFADVLSLYRFGKKARGYAKSGAARLDGVR